MDPLTNEIHNSIEVLDERQVLDDDTKIRMAMALSGFVEASILKFIKGQKEHGGKITDRDLNIEIFQEVIDLFWYTRAKQWKEQGRI